MNLSLYQLKKKLKLNKQAQGSLMAIVLGGVVLSTVVSSATAWYLSMNKTMSGTNDRLEAMTIAMSEWQRLEHMSLDELEANRENYKNPYDVGEKFKVGVTLGEQGFFDEGKCNSLTGTYAGENANCFKDTIMTVYDKDGNAMYTTRSLPLSVSRDSFPEGTILPYTGDLAKIPHGWVLCDGTNGTPDLRGRFLEGTGTTTGEFKQAGLPNITANFFNYGTWGGSGVGLANGATYYSEMEKVWLAYSTYYNSGRGTLYFDASRSNPVYGRSNTVQPPSFTVFYIMKTNKDFHYEHTNGFVSPEYYTKDEINTMFSDTKNYYNEKVNDINNRLSGNEFVKNYTSSYNLNLRYEQIEETNEYKLRAYYDNTEIPFAGTGGMGLPDWNKAVGLNHGTNIIQADGWLLYCASIHVTTDSNLFVNEQPITAVYNDASNEYRSEDSILIPVTKGDVVKSTGTKPVVFNFYPLK